MNDQLKDHIDNKRTPPAFTNAASKIAMLVPEMAANKIGSGLSERRRRLTVKLNQRQIMKLHKIGKLLSEADDIARNLAVELDSEY